MTPSENVICQKSFLRNFFASRDFTTMIMNEVLNKKIDEILENEGSSKWVAPSDQENNNNNDNNMREQFVSDYIQGKARDRFYLDESRTMWDITSFLSFPGVWIVNNIRFDKRVWAYFLWNSFILTMKNTTKRKNEYCFLEGHYTNDMKSALKKASMIRSALGDGEVIYFMDFVFFFLFFFCFFGLVWFFFFVVCIFFLFIFFVVFCLLFV